jgi:hypothetical protein
VVGSFPGGRTDRDVTDEADGVIGLEAFLDVDDLAVVVIGSEVGTLIGGSGEFWDADERIDAAGAGLSTEPLVALTVEVETISGEGVAEGANGTALVVVAADRPEGFVAVGGMGAQIDDPTGVETGVDGMEDDIVTEGGIAHDVGDVEAGVEGSELKQLGSEGVLLACVGRGEMVEQNEMEAAVGVGQEQRQTGIAIVALSPVVLLWVGVVGVV